MIELVREPQVAPVEIPAPIYLHLRRLTDSGGLYEHAEGVTPRWEHGYCLDDVARALVVVCRERDAPELDDLREQYLTFVLEAQELDGRFHNRRESDLTWSDTASVEDCWGRALWGLGTAVARAPHLRERALDAFDRGVELRSPHRRAMAFAALGAAEVLAVLPQHKKARALMTAVAIAVGRPAVDKAWPWPEPRLSYANAVLPEALLAAGAALDSPSLVADGLGLLGWLLDRQTPDGHLSVVPAGGRGPGDVLPAFDQQPIEVAALADACARAHRIAGTAAVGRGSRARRGVVPRRQRLRHPDARPGERGRLRRSGTHRPQREPGRGVHLGAARDAAAGSLDGAARAPEGQELVEERRMTECVTRTDVVLTADPRGYWRGCSSPGTSCHSTVGPGRRGSCPGSSRCPRTRSA